MKRPLTLECIGDDECAAIKSIEQIVDTALAPGLGRAFTGGYRRRPWVAEIVGTDPRFGFKREFVCGFKDYNGSNSCGSRGVMAMYLLEEGAIYEVNELLSWKRSRRYFVCFDQNGVAEELTADEVRLSLGQETGG